MLPPLTGQKSAAHPDDAELDPEEPVAQPGRVNFVPSGARGTMTALVGSMGAAVGVILVLLAGAVCLWRYRRGAVYPFSRRRKDSSISYSQQKDEVSAAMMGGGAVIKSFLQRKKRSFQKQPFLHPPLQIRLLGEKRRARCWLLLPRNMKAD